MNRPTPIVYWDYNATTPLDPAVRDVMLPFLGETYGNPSSIHQVGRRARALLDEARERAAECLGCKPSELVFTSGGTESSNLAILGTARRLRDRGRHLVVTPVEHHAVLHTVEYLERREGFEVTRLPVDAWGVVSPGELERALRPDTILVSVMAANNETGALQPVAECGVLCRERGVVFHTDAVQWFGKEPIGGIAELQADLVSLCAHKIHGPKGVGALFIRSPLQPEPILWGGGHEQDRRAGTENVAGIVGFTEALVRFVQPPVCPADRLREWTARIARELAAVPGVTVRSPQHRLANTLALTVEGADSISLLAGLDLEGICASSGSACSAGALTPSHVLLAMGVPRELASSFLRFSLGRDSTVEEVDRVLRLLPRVIEQIRQQ
jgi:cysteine desulfurase